ncbi:TIGR04086 family membrane protein [Acinetobacter wanghuae]|uniref:TIGR04086 family membrane protein n=1 Tax=Acinetobacter wanghuae TaxID=2662362 RepID=UPI001D0D8824|nr:TIGR04086 family membrane protein [Acinetobacter wanghuae]
MYEEKIVIPNRISWASVFAGVIAVLAISMLLSLLGVALGFALLDPESATDVGNGSGTAVTIWTIISLLISLGIGGFIAGRLATTDGYIHGFLVWALSLLVGIWFGAMTINNAARITGSAISSVTSAAGSVATGIGKGGVNLASLGTQAFEELVPLPEFKDGDVKLTEALQKTGIEELQPQYLKAQGEWAKDQIKASAKDLVLNPDDSDKIIQQLSNTLKNRAQAVTASIDRDEVSEALAKNTSLTPQEADQAVNNYLVQQNEFFNNLDSNIQKAKVQYVQAKEDAKEKAAVATNAAAKSCTLVIYWIVYRLIGDGVCR